MQYLEKFGAELDEEEDSVDFPDYFCTYTTEKCIKFSLENDQIENYTEVEKEELKENIPFKHYKNILYPYKDSEVFGVEDSNCPLYKFYEHVERYIQGKR